MSVNCVCPLTWLSLPSVILNPHPWCKLDGFSSPHRLPLIFTPPSSELIYCFPSFQLHTVFFTYFNKYITSVTTYQFKSYWWTWNPTVFLVQAQSYLLTFAQYHQVKDLFSNCLNRKGMFIKSSPLELTIIIWGTISFFPQKTCNKHL